MKWRSVLLFLTGLCSPTYCLPHQYHFIGTAMPWLKAQAYCRERHSDLATIFDIEDMNRLVNTAQDSTGGVTGKAWIGLHDNLTSWRWSFSDSRYYGDKEAHYRNWDFGQPDNFLGDQMCAKMWSGGVWDDSQCWLRNPFICYNETTRSNQRFIFVERELSWSDAQLYCRKLYTDLASVRDEKENQEIQHLAKNRSVWIGLYRTREWSDQSDSTYRYWRKGQPDNVGGIQKCTATDLGNAGLWSDEECSRELVFICHTHDVTPVKTSTTGHVSTKTGSSKQPSTPYVDQTRPITMTPNRRTTTEIELTTGHLSTETTSFGPPSSKDVDQTRRTNNETPNKPLSSTITTTIVIPNRRTTTVIESTIGHLSTKTTSFVQPSTKEVEETINSETQNQPALSTNKMTTIEGDSTSTEVSSQQYSTPKVDQRGNIPEHLIHLGVKFTSNKQLSEDDIKELVLVQFHNLLIEMGLPTSIKVGLKRPLK